MASGERRRRRELTVTTYHLPLCLAPTLGPRRVRVCIDDETTVRDVKLKLRPLDRTNALEPDRQRLFLVTKSRRTELDDAASLGDSNSGYDLFSGDDREATLLLEVKPFEAKVDDAPPPWCNHFMNAHSLLRRPTQRTAAYPSAPRFQGVPGGGGGAA